MKEEKGHFFAPSSPPLLHPLLSPFCLNFLLINFRRLLLCTRRRGRKRIGEKKEKEERDVPLTPVLSRKVI